MNILIPVFSFGRGGGERVLSMLATELIKNGSRVFFVCPESKSIPYYPTDADILTFPDINRFGIVIDFLINYFRLWKKCRSIDADIAIANYHITAYLVLFLSVKTKKYYYVQANEAKLCPKIIRKILAFTTYLLPLKKIVNSSTILPKIVNNYCAIIPAGVDLDLYRSNEMPVMQNNIKLGLVGRKEPYKGTREIIDILSSLDENIKARIKINIALHIPKESVDKLWDFEFFKIKSDHDLADFYKSCDIVLAAGLIEDGAFHYPCAEAMASGRLVISNYSPLVETDSHLKLKCFDESGILNALFFAMKMTSDEINNEVTFNFLKINEYSWDNIGRKMHYVLSSE